MSQEINNREMRKQAIKDMLKMLHEGKSVDEVKEYFAEVFGTVSASEISAAEQALIAEGMPVAEVQKLCDVHSAVFKGSIEEIHSVPESDKVGHPVWIMKQENRQTERLIDKELMPYLSEGTYDKKRVLSALKSLADIKIHYERKENVFFPYLEKYGIMGPPMVMWAVDDEIREKIKSATAKVEAEEGFEAEAVTLVKSMADSIKEMIFKEENILLPMLLETLTEEEWAGISLEIPDLGYFLIKKPAVWQPQKVASGKEADVRDMVSGAIRLPTGVLEMKELEGVLNVLPVDISFVDKNGVVKYFSENSERIFPRTKSIIGRQVVNCHPPGSMHIVEQILEDFAAGKKDEESFWIKMRGKYIYIRYFPVRKDGEFLGTLEVTQDITHIQSLTGEKRLMTE